MGSAFAASGPEQDVLINVSASGDNSVLAALAGYSGRLLSCTLWAAGAVTLTFTSDVGGSSVALSGAFPLTAALPLTLPLNDAGWATAALGKAFNFKLGGNVAVVGIAKFQQVR